MYCTHICDRHHKLLLHTYLYNEEKLILIHDFVSFIACLFFLEVKLTALINLLVARKLKYFDKNILYKPIFLRNQLLNYIFMLNLIFKHSNGLAQEIHKVHMVSQRTVFEDVKKYK